MKYYLKKLLPRIFTLWYRDNISLKLKSKFKKKNNKDIFTDIYMLNTWGGVESISGTGSDAPQTEKLIKQINNLLIDLNIKSVLDLPCGDFNWMQHVDLTDIDYIGADIVAPIIKRNKQKFENKNNIKFEILDLISDRLPASEIIVNRDCLVHLSFDNIYKAIKNIKLSGCKYLLTTTFVNFSSNYNIVTGEWRPINLEIHPFNFPKPIMIIMEDCTEMNGKYKDKSLGLWEVDKIKLPIKTYKSY